MVNTVNKWLSTVTNSMACKRQLNITELL